ncbi:hypothetical protein [Lacimonas salitolerans]|uniref:Radical SAM protein n=1 Tax=Lacimonas salitolerans TaxID=1323750 RepID=A0ABW4EB92_9RHOB
MTDTETHTASRPAPSDLRAMQRRIGWFQGSSYDISATCNLTCEGCLFFARADVSDIPQGRDADWARLFAAEAARGVNFAYIAGAEPSMVPTRLRAAWDHIKAGVIFTNGTRAIDPAIGYRIHVSLWGLGDTSTSLRGADVTAKALRLYARDPRAVFSFVITAANIHEIVPVARLCADHGARLTYSYFSPTDLYQGRDQATTQAGTAEAGDYMRLDDDLRMGPAEFADARAQIVTAMGQFPDTVRYSLHYNDWITQPDDRLWQLDAQGIAVDCGNRLSETHRHYAADATPNVGKCCTPNIDCAECRAYAMGMGTYVSRLRAFRHERAAWLEGLRIWFELFMPLEEQTGTV